LYPPLHLNKCIECHQPLRELYRTHSRLVRRLTGCQEIIEHVYGCVTPTCSRYDLKLLPERQTPPHSSYHFEVIFEVGRLRKQEHLTFQQILETLQQRGTLLGKNRSCVRHLFQYYETYEQSWAETDLQQQCQGQDVVLALDGVKPENGAPTLYLVKDALHSQVYGSNWLLYNGTEQLVPLLQQIQRLELNVVGVVSDKQRALLLAVQRVFGEVPHQYCQFHWFQAAFRLLSARDRHLNKQLKQALRQLRVITNTVAKEVGIAKIPSSNLQYLREFEPYLSVLLQAKNKPPFVLKGHQTWQRAKIILRSLLDLLTAVKCPLFGTKPRFIPKAYKSLVLTLRLVATTLEETLFESWEVHQAIQWRQRLEQCLDPQQQPKAWASEPRPQTRAKTRVEALLGQFASQGATFLQELQLQLTTQYEKWSAGLLSCFDYPYLPRTNNHLEQYISQVKQGRTKQTGRQNNHQSLRQQQCFRYEGEFPERTAFLAHCEQLTREVYQSWRQRYLQALIPLTTEYRIKRDFEGRLEQSFNRIRQEVTSSVACT